MSGVVPPEEVGDAGVDAVQRPPSRTDKQEQKPERHSGEQRTDQRRAEPQTESLVGGG
jgi:hypothetical protein